VIRLAILVLALGSGVLQLVQLRHGLAHGVVYSLEDQIRDGRFETSDAARLAPLAKARVQRPYACRAKRSLAFVKLYRVDLMADRRGTDPFSPSEDAALTRARGRAAEAVRDALHCTPLDGDLWLRLAVLENGLGAGQERVATLFAMSRETRPHEGRVMRLRQSFAPMLSLSDG
jgi:hypothetical protein